MSDKTRIEWTATQNPDGTVTPGATWNPTRGCTRVSAGCEHCYAESVAARFSGPGLPYEGLARSVNGHPRWTNRVMLVSEKLNVPLHWTRPRRVFVDSMSDLFHDQVPDAYLARVFAVMALSGRHTYQILTKRPERMHAWMSQPTVTWGLWTAPMGVHEAIAAIVDGPERLGDDWAMEWPPRNVWLGVSTEDQATADQRIPRLLQTPAVVRFISAEPLLGPIHLEEYLYPRFAADDPRYDRPGGRGLDWVITGAESGLSRRVRPMDDDWVRAIRDHCQATGVAFFFKQRALNGHKQQRPFLDGMRWEQYPSTQEVPNGRV